MADVMDRLFAEWHHLGAPVLLADKPTAVAVRPPETLIAESTAHCRDSGRLTWIVLAWLVDHSDEMDPAGVLAATRDNGDLSVLGVLSDAANHRRPHTVLASVMADCHPNPALELFFTRVSRSPLAARIAREHPVDVFLRWNFLCSELQYLDAMSHEAS